MIFLQTALPFLLGLLAGHTLKSRSPNGRFALVLYGIGGLVAIWVFGPNPFGFPTIVTIFGLFFGGVLMTLSNLRRLIKGTAS